jgi:hypothetical protein
VNQSLFIVDCHITVKTVFFFVCFIMLQFDIGEHDVPSDHIHRMIDLHGCDEMIHGLCRAEHLIRSLQHELCVVRWHTQYVREQCEVATDLQHGERVTERETGEIVGEERDTAQCDTCQRDLHGHEGLAGVWRSERDERLQQRIDGLIIRAVVAGLALGLALPLVALRPCASVRVLCLDPGRVFGSIRVPGSAVALGVRTCVAIISAHVIIARALVGVGLRDRCLVACSVRFGLELRLGVGSIFSFVSLGLILFALSRRAMRGVVASGGIVPLLSTRGSGRSARLSIIPLVIVVGAFVVVSIVVLTVVAVLIVAVLIVVVIRTRTLVSSVAVRTPSSGVVASIGALGARVSSGALRPSLAAVVLLVH